jgi:cytoskeletal protein CcmA (bactofilin family)
VQADVSARNLIVLGRLNGKVHVREMANIRATGTLEGELVTARLSVEIGAVLRAAIDIAKPEKDVKDSDRISAAERQPVGSLSKLEVALRS